MSIDGKLLINKMFSDKSILLEKEFFHHSLSNTDVLLIKIGDFYRSCNKDFTKAYQFYERAWKLNPKDRDSYHKIWTLCGMTKDKETSAKWSQLYKEYCK